jgi:hypothetical protein
VRLVQVAVWQMVQVRLLLLLLLLLDTGMLRVLGVKRVLQARLMRLVRIERVLWRVGSPSVGASVRDAQSHRGTHTCGVDMWKPRSTVGGHCCRCQPRSIFDDHRGRKRRM